MGAGDTQRINNEKSLAEQVRTLAAIMGIIATLAGVTGAFYVTIERVSDLQAEVAELKGWRRATETDLAASKVREAAAEKSTAETKAAMESVQRVLGNVQLTLARMCAGLRVRCE